MLSLVLVLLLVWFCLGVFLAAWTLFFQGYIYTEPAEGIIWRAPAAGTALTLFLVLWVVLDYRAPGRYQTVFEFSPWENQPPYPELRVVTPGGAEEVYKLRRSAGAGARPEYWRQGRPMPSRPDKIAVVEKNGEKVFFEPDRDADGKFKVGTDQTLHYRDDRGREMSEGQFGQVSTFRTGWVLLNLAVNALHLVAWFLCLWLLLRFQWGHALGLAVVMWAVMTLFIVPQVLDRAEAVARQRGASAGAAGGASGAQVDARMCMMSPSWTAYVLPSRR